MLLPGGETRALHDRRDARRYTAETNSQILNRVTTPWFMVATKFNVSRCMQ